MASEKWKEGKYLGYVVVHTTTTLLHHLLQYLQNDPISNKTIASTVVQFMQFQEDFLGKSAQKPPMTRIPVSKIWISNAEFYVKR